MQVVRDAWSIQVRGNAMYIFVSKLKHVKAGLREWRKVKASTKTQVVLAKQDLDRLQAAIQIDPVNTEIIREERNAVRTYAKAAKAVEAEVRTKSRATWLDKGDENDAYFYAFLKDKKNMNKIYCIYNEQGQRI